MEITSITTFLNYYERVRERTNRLIQTIPPDKIDWTYKEGKFTIGDVIRHIAVIERYMYAENVVGKPSRYQSCSKELADGYEATLAYFQEKHTESMTIFRNLSDTDLQKKCVIPSGGSITTWKWLRAMVEHEIHHRAQLYIYLNMLEVKTPPIFGLTSEELAAKGVK